SDTAGEDGAVSHSRLRAAGTCRSTSCYEWYLNSLLSSCVERDAQSWGAPCAGVYPKRNRLANRYSSTLSTAIQRRPSLSATAPVVFDPANGSRTRSSSSVRSLTKNSGSAAGKRAG